VVVALVGDAAAEWGQAGGVALTICPGDRIQIEVTQTNGARALLIGEIDSIPHCYWGGRVLKIRLADAQACALPPKMSK
jgi:hypothetical protein